MVDDDLRKVHEELDMIRQALDKLQVNKAGQLLVKETYTQWEKRHITATVAEPNIGANLGTTGAIEFSEPVESVAIFNLTAVAVYIDTESVAIDNVAATTTSIPLAGAVGAFVTIPIKTKRIFARTAADTAELVVWGLRK